MLKSELERVGPADIAQIVLDSPSRLLGSVARGRSPTREPGEIDIGKVLIAVHSILDADLVLPVLSTLAE